MYRERFNPAHFCVYCTLNKNNDVQDIPMLVLLIEDNRDLAANMIEYLEDEQFEVDYAQSGTFGLEQALKNLYDVVVLDINLPDIDGFSVCQQLRKHGKSLPIIMLTAKDALEHKLQGFNAGADDYLVKPFAMAELSARLYALSRRRLPQLAQLQVADLTVDLDNRTVMRDQQPIHLPKACFELLVLLMQASPKVIHRRQMEQLLWQGDTPDSDALKSHIYQLRKHIDKPFASDLLHTVRGVGLVLKP